MVVNLAAAEDRYARPDATPHHESYSRRYEDEQLNGKAAVCWDMLLKRTGDLANVRSVLDIGCGRGAFLDIARGAGLRTAGVEISRDAAEAAENAGHEILHGSILDCRFPNDVQFDVITMWDVLEHLERPFDALENAVSMLARDGQLLIVTPMMGSVFDRLGVLLDRVTGGHVDQLVRMCWSHDHLYRFHPGGLAQVLTSLGCRDVKFSKIQLLSLRSDCYAGSAVLPDWTASVRVNQLLSRAGVGVARAFGICNKVLVYSGGGTRNV